MVALTWRTGQHTKKSIFFYKKKKKKKVFLAKEDTAKWSSDPVLLNGTWSGPTEQLLKALGVSKVPKPWQAHLVVWVFCFFFTCNESHYKAHYECDLLLRRNQWKPLESVNVYLPLNATHTAFGATFKWLWTWGRSDASHPSPLHPNPTPNSFYFIFLSPQIWSPIRRKLRDYFQTRTHKPFGWVAIHLGRKKGAMGAIRNSLRFVDDIRQRFLSLEELRQSHISVHSQITGRASALNPPNAFLPKSVCSDFSRGFLLSGNMRFWMDDFCEIEFYSCWIK